MKKSFLVFIYKNIYSIYRYGDKLCTFTAYAYLQKKTVFCKKIIKYLGYHSEKMRSTKKNSIVYFQYFYILKTKHTFY